MGKKSKEILVAAIVLCIAGTASAETAGINDNYNWGGGDTRPCWEFQYLSQESPSKNILVAIVKADRSTYTAWGELSGFQFYNKGTYPATHRAKCLAFQQSQSPAHINWHIAQVILTNGNYALKYFNDNPGGTCNGFLNWVAPKNPGGKNVWSWNADGKGLDENGNVVVDENGNPIGGNDPTTQQAQDIKDIKNATTQAAQQAHDDANRAHDDAQDLKDKADEAASMPADRQEPTSQEFRPDPTKIEAPKMNTRIDFRDLIATLKNTGPAPYSSIDIDCNIPNVTNFSVARFSIDIVPKEGTITETFQVFVFWFFKLIFAIWFVKAIYTTLRQT